MEEASNPVRDTYKSISGVSRGTFKDNGSKFLAFAYPVETEEDARLIIRDLKKEYFDARHHCYAYRIGYDGSTWRASDDGEPSSSAGKPILGQILSNGLSDILIVVVRYFGGIKLGIPGLIRAYRESSAEAISAASLIEKTAMNTYVISFDYLQMNSVMKRIKDMSIDISDQRFDLRCRITAKVRLSAENRFLEEFTGMEGVTVTERTEI